MRTMIGSLAVVVAAAFATRAFAGGPCCDKAMADSSWCASCKTGFVGGVAVKNANLHKALAGVSAPAETKCDGCRKALASNGTCEHCKVEFANKLMYKSSVGHDLALGTCTSKDKIACDACKKNAAHQGWCDKCKVGMVGCFAFTERKAFDEAVVARATLVTALKAADKCEGCAIAMVTDGTCDHCKATFKGGKLVKANAKP